jgi:hypothetical protein
MCPLIFDFTRDQTRLTRSLEESWRNVFKIDPSGVEMVSSFVSISADEGVEMGFLTNFFSGLKWQVSQKDRFCRDKHLDLKIY